MKKNSRGASWLAIGALALPLVFQSGCSFTAPGAAAPINDNAYTCACDCNEGPRTARIAVAACAKDRGIDGAGRVCRHQFARLHAFDVDQAQAIARMDRNGDRSSARHRIPLLAGSEREDARLLDGRRFRRSRPEALVAGKNQVSLRY